MIEPIILILPVYKGKEMTEKCLDSIEKNTKYPYKIIIIIDEIDGDEIDNLYSWQRLMNIDLVIRKYREGIITAINMGMKIANGDVCFIQNDAEYPILEGDCWLTRLVKLSKEKDVGMVGCKNSVRDKPQHGYIGGWCCYIPKTTINKVGYLDMIFNPAQVDDIDYARRVMAHKLKIVTADFEVKHDGSGTLKDSNVQEELKQRNWQLYEEKWKDYREDMSEEEIKKYDYWG